MKNSFPFFVIFFLLVSLPLCPAQNTDEAPTIKVFNLTDGTTLKGSLISIEEDGRYLVDTTKLGEVLISPEEIVSITAENPAVVPTGTVPSQQPVAAPSFGNLDVPVQQAQEILTSDPAIMESIQKLMADPETMQLLQDPSLMKSLMTMDPEEMQANPKVQQLMSNPIMQEIVAKAKQKMEQQGALSAETPLQP